MEMRVTRIQGVPFIDNTLSSCSIGCSKYPPLVCIVAERISNSGRRLSFTIGINSGLFRNEAHTP
jgi:hypothetical protein